MSGNEGAGKEGAGKEGAETAGTVREALALAERTRPDATLLDVMLPDGDGRALGP